MSEIRKRFHLNGKVFICACCIGVLMGELYDAGRKEAWNEILDNLEDSGGGASCLIRPGRKKSPIKVNMFIQ